MAEPRRPIDVCITIDAEYDINDSLEKPETHSPLGFSSMLRSDGERSQGLGFILDTLGGHGLPATFFIEVFCAHFFGTGEVRRMVETIRAAGPHHDLQLHAHPCWRYFRDPEWRRSVKTLIKNDSWAGRGDSALPMLREAIELFAAITGEPPRVFRSGNLQVDTAVHAALAQLGIPASSSVGLGLSMPESPALRRWLQPTRIDGVLEVPVAAYREPGLRGDRVKCLTITGTAWPVTRRLLDWAHRMQRGPLVILTHASEFATPAGACASENGRYRADPLNQMRLRALAAFLARERSRFNTTTFAAGLPAWQAAPQATAGQADDAVFVAPRLARLTRAVETAWTRWRPWPRNDHRDHRESATHR